MESLLLKALATRQRFTSLREAVPQGMMSPDTIAMLAWYQAYFQAFGERDHVDPDELVTFIKLRSGAASPESVALTVHLAQQLKEPAPESSVNSILEQLYELDLSGKAGALVTRFNEGGEVDLTFEMGRLAEEAKRRRSSTSSMDFVRDDIGSILEQLGRDDGLKFDFIPALNSAVRGLIPGDSAMFAARVDAGKSSFLCKMATSFAPQVKRFFGEGRPIVFLVNESEGSRMLPRLRQAALRLTLPELIDAHRDGSLEERYKAALGGTDIEVKNIHGWNLVQVERFVEQVRPSVCITDMPANIRMNIGNGSKTDALEYTWQVLRDLGVNNGCIMFGTAQISVEGADQLYPPMTALKDTKTGVQGALDLQINMGSLNNPDAAKLRGISTPKNKLSITGQPSCVQSEVWFDKDRCQFDSGAA